MSQKWSQIPLKLEIGLFRPNNFASFTLLEHRTLGLHLLEVKLKNLVCLEVKRRLMQVERIFLNKNSLIILVEWVSSLIFFSHGICDKSRHLLHLDSQKLNLLVNSKFPTQTWPQSNGLLCVIHAAGQGMQEGPSRHPCLEVGFGPVI